jgi:hypothetical protein
MEKVFRAEIKVQSRIVLLGEVQNVAIEVDKSGAREP